MKTLIGISKRLVGRPVTFTAHRGSTRHGVVVRASYNFHGEPVLVVRPDDDPVAVCANMVLIGPDAESVIAELDPAV
jgi:hypothetical protein